MFCIIFTSFFFRDGEPYTTAWICRVAEGRINSNNTADCAGAGSSSPHSASSGTWIDDANHPFHKSGGWGYKFTVEALDTVPDDPVCSRYPPVGFRIPWPSSSNGNGNGNSLLSPELLQRSLLRQSDAPTTTTTITTPVPALVSAPALESAAVVNTLGCYVAAQQSHVERMTMFHQTPGLRETEAYKTFADRSFAAQSAPTKTFPSFDLQSFHRA